MEKSYIDFYYESAIKDFMIKEFEKKIYYISEKILSYERIYDQNKIIGVRIWIEGKYKEDELRKHITEIIENEIKGLKNINNAHVWDKDEIRCANSSEVLKECIEKKLVIIPGDGQVILGGHLVELFRFFDGVFREISMHLHGCQEYQFPTLLKTDTLKKVGYFESFPNLLMFVMRLKNEIVNFQSFKQDFEKQNTDILDERELMKYCCDASLGLPPTMCYYVYEMLYGQEVNNYAITAVGKSFRYENKYCKPFERLWDFTIRETVFLGERSFVKKQVKSYRNYAIKFMELLNLKGICENANDPFFLDHTTKKINVQKMMGSKQELRLRINEEDTMAIGSFNIHGQFLAKRFKLYTDKEQKEYAYTGCIGIGLERILFGFLSQYGCEIEKWPNLVKQCINDSSYISKIIYEISEGNDGF